MMREMLQPAMTIAEALYRMKGLDVSDIDTRHQQAWNAVLEKLEAIAGTGIIDPSTKVNHTIAKAIRRLESDLERKESENGASDN